MPLWVHTEKEGLYHKDCSVMLGIKRKRGRSHSADKPRKSPKVPQKKDGHPDGAEGLELTLQKLREQEESDSEALARKLQREFDGPSSLACGDDGIDLTCRGETARTGPTMEDDEALARKLAREWEELDAAESVPLASHAPDATEPAAPTSDSVYHGKSCTELSGTQVFIMPRTVKRFQPASSGLGTSVPSPDEDLARYRDLFTQSRPCTKCSKSVASPRGQVN